MCVSVCTYIHTYIHYKARVYQFVHGLTACTRRFYIKYGKTASTLQEAQVTINGTTQRALYYDIDVCTQTSSKLLCQVCVCHIHVDVHVCARI